MALIERLTAWASGDRAIRVAEEIVRRSEAAGPPPAVGGLSARRRAAYDRLVDALNRLPRPLMVLGTLALLAAALAAPGWFSDRMEALSRMPEGLWWIIGAVLSLHFGARYQAHAQAHEREIVEAVVAVPAAVPAKEADSPDVATPGPDATVTLSSLTTGPNAALTGWKAGATQP